MVFQTIVYMVVIFPIVWQNICGLTSKGWIWLMFTIWLNRLPWRHFSNSISKKVTKASQRTRWPVRRWITINATIIYQYDIKHNDHYRPICQMCWANLSVRSHFILWRLKKRLFSSFNIWGYIYCALGSQWHLYTARLVRPAITLFLCNPTNSHKMCVMCPGRSGQLNCIRLHCFLKHTIITSLLSNS